MRFRAGQLACFFLLLSTLGAGEASALRSPEFGLHCQRMGVLLQQGPAATRAEGVMTYGVAPTLVSALPAASRAVCSAAWEPRPPAAQAARLHAVTGSRI